MRKRITAAVMALILALFPVLGVCGGEIVIDEISAEDVVIEEAEILPREAVQTVQMPDAALLRDVMDDTAEPEWQMEGTVVPSGRALDAVRPRARIYGESVYVSSYGGQLTGNAQRVYRAMVTEFVQNKGMDTIYITMERTMTYQSGDSYGKAAVEQEVEYMVQSAFDAFKYDYPEVYWLGLISYGAQVKKPAGDTVCTVSQVRVIPREDYPNAFADRAAFDASVNTAVQKISAQIPAGASTRDKVLAIHDYICRNTAYDLNYQSYSSSDPRDAYIHSAAGFFLKSQRIVCEGYAKSFKILCTRFGIEAVLITGDASGGGHMWNYVRMDDGNWYLVDATWNDNDAGITYYYFLAGSRSKNQQGKEIGLERQLYLNFSPSSNTKTFAAPILTAYSYDVNHPSHVHVWTSHEVQKPTCQSLGYDIRKCVCGEVTVEMFSKTEHSFRSLTVYNQDATCLSDGTRTYYCDYGCGTAGRTVTAENTKILPTFAVSADSIRLKKGQSTRAVRISGLGPADYVDSWKSTKKSVVRVTGKADGTCKITARKVGEASVIATLKSGIAIRITVRVQKKAVQPSSIRNISSKLTLKKGKTKQLKPDIAPLTCVLDVTYTSSNKKVATVSKSGKIRARKKGKTTITVRCGSKKKTCRVTVK